MSTQTISTLNGVTQAAGVSTNLIISGNSLPSVSAISGYCNGAANTQYFLQLFNANNDTVTPVNGAVPLYTWQILGVDGFLFNFRPNPLDTSLLDDGAGLTASSGLVLYLSTTEATLTIATGNVTMDCEVDIDATVGSQVLSQVAVGNTTTAVASLLVSATPSQSRLMSFNVKNNTGATGYLMLFGGPPTTGDVAIQQWKILNGIRLKQNFGAGFFVIDGNPTTYVNTTGLYLYGSSTTQTFTATAATWTMQANYL